MRWSATRSMPQSSRKSRRREQGQDIIELALVLPLVLVIVMGIVDLGRAFNTYMVIVNAAREAARTAAVDPYATSSISEAALRETRRSGISDGSVTVTVTSASVGSPIQVTVRTDFPLLSGVLPVGTIPLSASVQMVRF
jgi:Flp pilus assembly protein TadG